MPPKRTLSFERYFKSELLAHLGRLGFVETEEGLRPPDDSKECLRAMHQLQRRDVPHRELRSSNMNFGCPNWKLRATGQELEMRELDPNLWRHGIKPKVFVCVLANIAEEVLRGVVTRPDYSGLLTAEEVRVAAVERRLLGRAASDPKYIDWKVDQLGPMLDIELRQEARPRVAGEL